MKIPGFIGPSYTLKSVNVNAQRCVNLYPELLEGVQGKNEAVAFLKSTPGLELLAEVGSGPIRLIHQDLNGTILVVSGDKLYKMELVEGVWTSELLSTDELSVFDTSSGPVKAASNRKPYDNPEPASVGTNYFTVFVDGSGIQMYYQILVEGDGDVFNDYASMAAWYISEDAPNITHYKVKLKGKKEL